MDNLNYRVREGYPRSDCAEAWATHRKTTQVLWGLIAGWIPFYLVIAETSARFLPKSNFKYAFIAAAAYIAGLVVVGNMVNLFRCPRCGSRFYAWGPFGLGHNMFKRHCRNCGLCKWQCDGLETDSSAGR